MNTFNTLKKESGFALLFTVLVITLVLTITVGISSTTFKQGVLSGLARDSQTAFYQADRLLECALLYRNVSVEGLYDQNNNTFTCAGIVYEKTLVSPSSSDLYFRDISGGNSLAPCAVLRVIPKDSTSLDNTASLQSSGYNICQIHPRQVERTLLAIF